MAPLPPRPSALGVCALTAIYRVSLSKKALPHGKAWPGAVFSSIGLVIGTAVFSLFIGMSSRYSMVYGSLACHHPDAVVLPLRQHSGAGQCGQLRAGQGEERRRPHHHVPTVLTARCFLRGQEAPFLSVFNLSFSVVQWNAGARRARITSSERDRPETAFSIDEPR